MPLSRSLRLAFLLSIGMLAMLVLAEPVNAEVAISEVLWVGSDLKTSDEWVELAGFNTVTDLSGWSLTAQNSSGMEVPIITFADGTTIGDRQHVVISRYPATDSRISDAASVLVSSSMSLLNSKLLLRLRNASGAVVDQVDDGVGEPFAGGTTEDGRKASMERLDLEASGSQKANWVTAMEFVGWDPDATLMLGTPGYPRAENPLPRASSSSSSTSVTSVPSVASVPSCTPRDPFISIQSGAASGEEKVTINVQVLLRSGTLPSGSCTVDFGDEVTSQTCNPPSHMYDRVGNYSLLTEVNDGCGATVERMLTITVTSGAKSSLPATSNISAHVGPTGPVGTFGSFVLTAAFPNPPGNDKGGEWIELLNAGDRSANLEGWKLLTNRGKVNAYTFGSVVLPSAGSARFPVQEMGLVLPNQDGRIGLHDPSGAEASVIQWKNAAEGKTYAPAITVSGSVDAVTANIVDGDTLDVEIVKPDPARGLPRHTRIRLIGIDAPEPHDADPRLSALAGRAAAALEQLTDGRRLTLEFDAELRDAYNRILAYVTVDSGQLLQEVLLSEGLASVELRFPFSRREEFLRYQDEAREMGMGLWNAEQSGRSARAEEIEEIKEIEDERKTMRRTSAPGVASIIKSQSSVSKRVSRKSPTLSPPKAKRVSTNIRYRSVVEETQSSLSLSGSLSPLPPEYAALLPLISQVQANDGQDVHDETSGISPFILLVVQLIAIPAVGLLGWGIGRKMR